MYSNEEYEKLKQENDKYFTVLKYVSYTLGLWAKAPYSKLFRRILFTIWMLAHFGSMYAQILFFIHNFGHIYNIAEVCCSLVTHLCTSIKILQIYFLRTKLEHIIDNMVKHKLLNEMRFLRKDINHTEILRKQINEVMQKSWRESRLSTVMFARLACMVPVLYTVVPFVLNMKQFLTNQNNFKPKFPFKTYYPKMENLKYQPPYFQLLFIMESLSGFSTLIGVITFDGLYVYMVMYATAMVRTLNRMIAFSTSQNIPKQIRVGFLKECIQYHTKVLRFSGEINNLFSAINLMQLFCSTSIICTIAFHASHNQDNGAFTTILMVIYLLAGIYQLGLYCYYGQGLINESLLIPMVCYQCDWFDCSEDFKKILRMIMLRTQKGITISAWSLSVMSLITFSTILRTAASYFTVLTTMADS